MEAYDEIVRTIALVMGVGWASGINLYATLLVLGYLNGAGHVELPPSLQILSDPVVMGAAAFMYFVEFFADKTPGVDTAWDTLHTFIRIPAGAVLAAGAIGEGALALQVAAAILGGGLAAGTHATKAGSRLLINTSPEPFSNWGASLGEDAMVVGGLWIALTYPVLFLLLLVLFVALMVWLLPKLVRAIRRLWRRLQAVFRVTRRGEGEGEGSQRLPPPDSRRQGTDRD